MTKMVNTVIFSVYDSGYRSSALLLSDGIDWGMANQTMYKKQIPYADEIADYGDERSFAFFSQMFNAEIRRVVIVIDGEVYKIRCNCSRGYFGYEMADRKVEDAD